MIHWENDRFNEWLISLLNTWILEDQAACIYLKLALGTFCTDIYFLSLKIAVLFEEKTPFVHQMPNVPNVLEQTYHIFQYKYYVCLKIRIKKSFYHLALSDAEQSSFLGDNQA